MNCEPSVATWYESGQEDPEHELHLHGSWGREPASWRTGGLGLSGGMAATRETVLLAVGTGGLRPRDRRLEDQGDRPSPEPSHLPKICLHILCLVI